MAKVLLVEDSETQAEATRSFLKKEGYEVIWVSDGASVIKVAKIEPPDVILLDLILPDMSGHDVCRWLKHDEGTRGIPIIMLTVKADIVDKVAGLEAGADDYLPKPYSEIELNARIYASLRTKALQDELRQKNRQLEELLKQVEMLAITDQLTGLYNRRKLIETLQIEFKKALRYNTPLSSLMIDIDRFKRINDLYGHHIGDVILREIAQTILRNVRGVDIVARWGGEEFVVLLPQTKKQDALQLASRLIQVISGYKFKDIPEEQITISIGLSSIPEPSISTEEGLIQTADSALYSAKTKGRNRVEVVEEPLKHPETH